MLRCKTPFVTVPPEPPSFLRLCPLRFGSWSGAMAGLAVAALLVVMAGLSGCSSPVPKASGTSATPVISVTAPGAVEPPPMPPPFLAVSSAPFHRPFPAGAFLAARHAEAIHDAGRAKSLLSQVLSVAPEDPRLVRMILRQSIAAGARDDAVRYARTLKALGVQSTLAEMILAVADLAEGRFEAVESRLGPLPAGGLYAYTLPLLRGWALAGAGDHEAALAVLEPLSPPVGFEALMRLHRALITLHKGDEDLARSRFEALLEAEAPFLREVLETGAYFERAGAQERAIAHYRQVLSMAPDMMGVAAALARARAEEVPPPPLLDPAHAAAAGLSHLAHLLARQGATALALRHARLGLFLAPGDSLIRMLDANILAELDRFEEALAAYDSLNADDPLAWHAGLRAAEILDRMDRVEEALARLEGIIVARPDETEALMLKGDLLRFRSRFAEAAAAYDRVFDRLENMDRQPDWLLHYARGIAHERMSDWPRAEQDFLASLELDPAQPLVLNYLGYSWIDQGLHLERALDMVARAVEMRPNDGYIIDSLGWAHYRLGDFDEAVLQLERAVAIRPFDPVINDHLGDAYWQVGRELEARFQWQRALDFATEEVDADSIRRKLREGLSRPNDPETGQAAPVGS